MSTNMYGKVIMDSDGNAISPYVLSDTIFTDDKGTTLKSYLSNNQNGSVAINSDLHQLALAGSASFTIDYTTNTITHGTWTIYTPDSYFTTSNFSNITMNLGSSNAESNLGDLYYLVVRPGGMEVIKAANMKSDTSGIVVCALDSRTVYPALYPIDKIKVIGGTMKGHPYKSLGKVALIGDSITFGGCMDPFLNDLPGSNLAVSGATVRGTAGLVAQSEKVTSDYNVAIIMGGTNDQGSIVKSDLSFDETYLGTISSVGSNFDKATFYGAYQYIIETLLTVNPKMKILMCCPPRAWSDASTERVGMEKVGDAVKNVAAVYSIPVVDLWHNCPINSLTQSIYLQDFLHPTDAGNSLIGNIVRGEFIKHYCGGNF